MIEFQILNLAKDTVDIVTDRIMGIEVTDGIVGIGSLIKGPHVGAQSLCLGWSFLLSPAIGSIGGNVRLKEPDPMPNPERLAVKGIGRVTQEALVELVK